ncbi:MAG: hypothetical protein ACKO5K_17275, partial [Armatimonadota bacterium]
MTPTRRVPVPPPPRDPSSSGGRAARDPRPRAIADRSRVVFAIVAVVYVVLFLRLVWVQALAADRYAGKSAVSRTKVVSLRS